jgi:1-acyl-sn-glycerol-3-phosphate acyltransferase
MAAPPARNLRHMAYWFVKVVLTPLLRLIWRIDTRDRDRVPARGAAILASNHQSFIDSILIPLVIRRRVTFLAKAEYFETWKTAWFFKAVGQIPIRRGGGSASERALVCAREVLEAGGLLGVYPEGTRSTDGRIYRGRTGVARMALRCGVPVVPVAVAGTREIQPIGCMRPKLFRSASIRFGVPMSWPELRGAQDDPEVLRRVTDEIMAAIAGLAGQTVQPDYVKKDRLPVPGRPGGPDRGDEVSVGPEPAPAAGPVSRDDVVPAVGRIPSV